VVLVVGVGYLLIQRGVLPAPPSPTRPSPEADTPADNSAAIGRLGGTVQDGHVDPATGQRSGVTATITPAMVAAAAHDQLGSAADPNIRPPGLDQLPARNRPGRICSAASSAAPATCPPTWSPCTRPGPTPR
jgi:hypothetical protein